MPVGVAEDSAEVVVFDSVRNGSATVVVSFDVLEREIGVVSDDFNVLDFPFVDGTVIVIPRVKVWEMVCSSSVLNESVVNSATVPVGVAGESAEVVGSVVFDSVRNGPATVVVSFDVIDREVGVVSNAVDFMFVDGAVLVIPWVKVWEIVCGISVLNVSLPLTVDRLLIDD